MSTAERNLFRIVHGLLLAVALYYAGTIVSLLTSTEAEARATQQPGASSFIYDRTSHSAREVSEAHYKVIMRRDVFNDPKPPVPRTSRVRPSLPPLRARLLGVMRSGEGSGFAVIEDPRERRQRLLSTGDVLQGRQIVRVGRNHVTLRAEKGPEERLELPLPPRTLVSELTAPNVDDGTPRYVDAGFLPFMTAATTRSEGTEPPAEAMLKPQIVDGDLRGIRLTAIVPNSRYHRIGFKNGDLVVAVDGKPFVRPLDGLRLIREFRTRVEGTVELLRRSEPVELDLSAPPETLAVDTMLGRDDGPLTTWDWEAEARLSPVTVERGGPKARTRKAKSAETRVHRDAGYREIRVSTPSEWEPQEFAAIPSSSASEWADHQFYDIPVHETSHISHERDAFGSTAEDSSPELPPASSEIRAATAAEWTADELAPIPVSSPSEWSDDQFDDIPVHRSRNLRTPSEREITSTNDGSSAQS